VVLMLARERAPPCPWFPSVQACRRGIAFSASTASAFAVLPVRVLSRTTIPFPLMAIQTMLPPGPAPPAVAADSGR